MLSRSCFLKQASETRQRATDLYDRLRKDQQITESIALASTIEAARVRSAVKAQMALRMAGLDPSPINLMNFTSTTHGPHQAQVSTANPDEITSPQRPIAAAPPRWQRARPVKILLCERFATAAIPNKADIPGGVTRQPASASQRQAARSHKVFPWVTGLTAARATA
jgi:hypothetical protein